MNIVEATICFLFRPIADPGKAEKQRQRTCRILRNITDPAEAVGECLTDKDHEHDATAKSRTAHGR